MIDHTQGFVKTVVMVAAEWDVTLPRLEYPRAIKEVLYFIQFLWGSQKYINKLKVLRNEEEIQERTWGLNFSTHLLRPREGKASPTGSTAHYG